MPRLLTAALLLAFAAAASAADGAAVFKIRCAVCHGPEASGGKIMPRAVKGTAAAKVLEMVKKGGGKMRPVALTDEDAQAVAKYVSGLK